MFATDEYCQLSVRPIAASEQVESCNCHQTGIALFSYFMSFNVFSILSKGYNGGHTKVCPISWILVTFYGSCRLPSVDTNMNSIKAKLWVARVLILDSGTFLSSLFLTKIKIFYCVLRISPKSN